MWCALLVCLFALSTAADVKTPTDVEDAKDAVVKRQAFPTDRAVANEGVVKRQSFPTDAVARGAHPDAYPTSYPGGVASYGAAPGQYVVRAGPRHQEVPPEYLEYIQQVAQQQQQEVTQHQILQQQDLQQRQQNQLQQQQAQLQYQQAQLQGQQQQGQQQPQLVQQLVVTRDPSLPRRPATRRPPTEQQLLQQSFFQSNQLQGQLRQLAASRTNPTPSGAAPSQQDLDQARYQQALVRPPRPQVYSQAPQVFPQPAPTPRQSSVEQYLRETSPSQPPLIVSLNREEISVQTTPDQAVYYTATQAQPTQPTRPAYQQQADLATYLRQQHAATSAAPPQYYEQVSPSAAPPQYLQQHSPSAAPPQYFQQQSLSAVPPQYLQQQSPSAAPPQYLQQQSPSAAPPQYRPSPAPRQPQYQTIYRPQPEEYLREQQVYQPRQQQQQTEEQNEEFVSSILSQYPGRNVNAERAGKSLPSPSPSPSRSSIFVTTASSRPSKGQVADVEADDDSNALPVVRLPTPQGQRALTQREYQSLIAAGFDIQPVQESRQQVQQVQVQQVQQPTAQPVYYQTSPKYQRSYVTAAPPTTNQISRTRTKLQQIEPEEPTGFDAIVVADEEPKQVRQRPSRPQVRYTSRPQEVYRQVLVDGQAEAQTAYVTYDNAPRATYTRVRGSRRRPQEQDN